MINSWDFLQTLDTIDISRIEGLLYELKVMSATNEPSPRKDLYKLISYSVTGNERNYISYFDFLAYYCDLFSTPLSSNVQKVEDEILLHILLHFISNSNNNGLRRIADLVKITYEGKNNLITSVKNRHKSSIAFKEHLPQLLLNCNYFRQNPYKSENPRLELLIYLIKCRWWVIKPMTREDACDYVLSQLKTSGNIPIPTDYLRSCQFLACIVSLVKGNLPHDILQLLEDLQVPKLTLPELIQVKLLPHSDSIVDMLMKRIGKKNEKDIDLIIKANEIYKSGVKVLFTEYSFPYTVVSDECQYLDDFAHFLANSLFLYYKLGDSFHDVLVSEKEISKNYDYIICLAENEQSYARHGKTFVIDKVLSPYLKYEEISKDFLLFFTMPLDEIKREIVKSHGANNFSKVLQKLFNIKEQANLAQNSLARLRHDYSADLGIIHDYIQKYSSAEDVEKEEALNCYKRITSAIGYIGKEMPKEPYDLNKIITDCIVSDKNNKKKYFIEFKSDVSHAYALVNKEVFSTSVLKNIFSNALRHGFILEGRPVENNKIEVYLFDNGDSWGITIMNNGVQFKGDKNKVFEKGYKSGPTGNTGEGMNSVYISVVAMGGDVSFESIPEAEYPVIITINIPKENGKKM